MAFEPVPKNVFAHYQRLQQYVGWTDADARRVRGAGPIVELAFGELVDDFYHAIQREPDAAKVITGGSQQFERLKGTLHSWLGELFCGQYDEPYVARRWKVGWRHVEIGLNQVYVNVALSRLRSGLVDALQRGWKGQANDLAQVLRSLNHLLDLDLAIIEDAYQAEYAKRQQEIESLKRIAEQQRAQRREAAFGHILDESLNEIYMFDSEALHFVQVNRGARENIGYSMEELRGLTPLELKRAFTRESFEQLLQPLRTGAKRQVQFNTVHRRKDGTLYDVEVHLQLSNLETPPIFVAIILDITERKRAEERALQAERLAAIGQTVAGLAHESRNAFQRSQACLEMLALELEGRPNELELVDRVQRALDHLHHLYEEVRDYAAPIKLDRQSCNLAHLWRDAWSHLELMRKQKNVELLEATGDGDLTCEVDWFQMGQVFRNILENAINACPEPGKIAIVGRETKIDDRAGIEILIRDNGPGIPPAVKQRVFDAFFTTKTKGTGLGMAIARRIVDAHGGQIVIGDSSPGAEIMITLPRCS